MEAARLLRPVAIIGAPVYLPSLSLLPIQMLKVGLLSILEEALINHLSE
jgi:hypothetical protein